MIAYGKNVIKELLDSNQKITKAFIYEKSIDEKIINALRKRNVDIKLCSKKEMDDIAKGNHQGIIVNIPDYDFYPLEELMENADKDSLIVLLDHIEDPHNLGAIIRTCEAAGVRGIIITKNRSVDINSTVMKVSAGALTNIKVCSVTNVSNTIRKLKENGFWIVGTEMNADYSYMDIDYDTPICLVIGNEGFGMSRIVKAGCDYTVSIPMVGKINSLNASVATGIIVYGILEKRRK